MPSLHLPQLRLRRATRQAGSVRPRSQLAPARRRGPLTLRWRRLVLTATLLAVTAGLAYGTQLVLLGDTLRVQDVTVIGTEVADPFDIAAAAGVTGQSLLWLDSAAAAARIASLPAVRSATVQRDWPRGVVIDVTEHQGWGYWQLGSDRRVIDVEGQISERARPPDSDAPTIIELGPAVAAGERISPDRDAVQLVDRLLSDGTFNRLRVTEAGFLFQRDRGLVVLIDGGPDAVFGDSHNYEFKVAAWGALLDRIEEQRIEVQEIDLRFGRHVVMR